MNIMQEILQRKSIRNFKPDKIEKDKVERILEAGDVLLQQKTGNNGGSLLYRIKLSGKR